MGWTDEARSDLPRRGHGFANLRIVAKGASTRAINRLFLAVEGGMAKRGGGFEPAQGNADSVESGAVTACVVLIVASRELAAIADMTADLARDPEWRADRSVTIVWQPEPALGETDGAAAPAGFLELSGPLSLQPGLGYWIPPDRRAWFEGRRLLTAPRSADEHHPLDHLLLSLAEGWGPHSVAALALPPGEDGECGLRIIRAVGGVARQYTAGGYREVAPPVRIAAQAERSARARPRLERVLALPANLHARASMACKTLVRSAREQKRARLRVWVPGCDTGGTALVTAMMLSDEVARERNPARITIFGTDDDEDVLSIARIARYPANAALGCCAMRRSRVSICWFATGSSPVSARDAARSWPTPSIILCARAGCCSRSISPTRFPKRCSSEWATGCSAHERLPARPLTGGASGHCR
jgi:hypothetical protein